MNSYEITGAGYSDPTLTYGGDGSTPSACVQSILDLVPRRWRTDPVMEITRVMAEEICRTKASIDDLSLLYSIDQTAEQMLPLLLRMWGLKVFPHHYEADAKRRYVRYLIEAIKYKGTLYALDLLAKGLLSIDLVTVVDWGNHILQTYPGGGGYDPGTLAGDLEGDTAQLRSHGLPFYSYLPGDRVEYGTILIAIEARLDEDLALLNERIRLLRSLVALFIPATVQWEIRVTAYHTSDRVTNASDSLDREEDAPWAPDESFGFYFYEPFVTGQSGYLAWTFHSDLPLLEIELTDEIDAIVHRSWHGQLTAFSEGPTSSPPYIPALKFNVPENSQYLPLL